MDYPPNVWLQALVVPTPRMCGRALRPYSLAHEMVLRGLCNPILWADEVTRADLMQAVWVTQRTLGECRQLFANTWQVYLRLSVFAWRWRHLPLSLSVRKWRQYRDDCSRAPEHWVLPPKDGERQQANAAIEYHIVRRLCSEWGMTFDEAWDCPRGLALCCWDASAEREGDKSLMSRFDELVRHAHDMRAAAVAAGDEAAAREWAAESSALCAAYREQHRRN